MPPEYKQDPKRVAVWKKLFGALHQRRTLTRADSAAAELLVEDWIRWEVVNAEAQAHPFSEVTWRDSLGNVHTKMAESAASKMATSMHRSLMQGLQQFSATPATREKTKRTKEAALKPGKVQSVAERIAEEMTALQEQLDAVEEATNKAEDLHSCIDETVVGVKSATQVLLEEADKLLAEEEKAS